MKSEEEKEKEKLLKKYPGSWVVEETEEYHTKGRQNERRYNSAIDRSEWGQFVRDGVCFICGETDVRTFNDHHVFGTNFVFEGKRDRNNEITIITESLVITLCANCHEINRGWGGYKKKVNIQKFSMFGDGEFGEESATKYTHYWSVLKGIERGFMFTHHSRHEKNELIIELNPGKKKLVYGMCFICGELDYRKFINHHVLGHSIKGMTITLCANCHKKNNGWYDKEWAKLWHETLLIDEKIPREVFSDSTWTYPREYWPKDIREKDEETTRKREDHAKKDRMEITLYLHGKSWVIEKDGYAYRHIKNVLNEIENGVIFN